MGQPTPAILAVEQRWLEFLGSDCLDLLEYDFWLSPPEGIDPGDLDPLTAADWNNGPCWDVAAAVRMWLGPAASIEGLAVHACARVGDFYLDGDGISDAATLARRWAKAARASKKPAAPQPLPRAFLAEHITADLTLALARRMRKLLDKGQFLEALAPEAPALGV